MTIQIICLGITTLDRVWPIATLPATSGKYRATGYLEVGGGMAANAAVAVARLGGAASYWGRAGDDSVGHTMKKEMAACGVNVDYFRLYAQARSSTSAILVSHDGERLIVNYPGKDLPDDTGWLPLDLVPHAPAIHADIRWVSGAKAIYSAARKYGIPTVLDAEIADQEAFSAVLPLTEHAIFSESGLRSFIGNPALTYPEYANALHKVRVAGCRVAAVTRGSLGVLWLDENGLHECPAFTVDVIDTTGAGDVFHGAYALAIGEGKSVQDAMRFSSAVSALKCTRAGGRAGIPTYMEAYAFMAERTSHF
jgi:sulfofructose kinase